MQATTGARTRRASSTWIRELLAAGRVREAAKLWAAARHPLEVVHGEQRGRELGFPTANSRPTRGFLPADGVYAGWATVDGARYPAAVSMGNNPTFDDVPVQRVEAYVLDQKLDLYGKEIELEFVDYVRADEEVRLGRRARRPVRRGRHHPRDPRRAGLAARNPRAPVQESHDRRSGAEQVLVRGRIPTRRRWRGGSGC